MARALFSRCIIFLLIPNPTPLYSAVTVWHKTTYNAHLDLGGKTRDS